MTCFEICVALICLLICFYFDFYVVDFDLGHDLARTSGLFFDLSPNVGFYLGFGFDSCPGCDLDYDPGFCFCLGFDLFFRGILNAIGSSNSCDNDDGLWILSVSGLVLFLQLSLVAEHSFLALDNSMAYLKSGKKKKVR